MQQAHSERSFSRRKHQSGHWRTTDLSAANPVVRWCVRQLSFKHRELDAYTHRCLPGAVMVDFGAGTGAYSRFFLQRCGATVIAVDWSPEALRAIAPPLRGTILPVCADLHCLPIKSSAVDGLFSIDTLGHLQHQEKALDEINRICRSGAPLFLHSECSDYRQRWPDRRLIMKAGHDPIAAIDGHHAIRPASAMRSLYEQRFTVLRFFSPAGIFGWLLGYPEKYRYAFRDSRMFVLASIAGGAACIRNFPGMKAAFRCVNMLTNRLELFLGFEGGGSCFAQCRRIVDEPRASGSSVPSLDIIVPTYRRSALLQPLIDAVVKQCTGNDRVIVVWQGNEPPSVDGGARVHVLHRKKPNLPAARNIGLAAGGNPIVLYLDDDCIVQNGLLDAHRGCYADGRTGAVGGFVDDPLFPPEADLPSWFDITTGEIRQYFELAHSSPAISVMGANMSFRRSALETIGGFDSRYRRNAFFEDVDASFRVQRAGYSIHYCASARVKHQRTPEGGCRSDNGGRYLFHTFANVAYFTCTFARVKDLRTWLHYWKYRLEHLSRLRGSASPEAKIRHDPLLVMVGLTGAVSGILRFMIHGKRAGFPDAVIDAYNNRRQQRRVKAGWIYPHRERCGIAQYSQDYIDSLSAFVDIVDIDPGWWFSDRKRFRRALEGCDLVHIQYDTSAFFNRGGDFYAGMLQSVKIPVIVTLHEVYDEDPSVFPRSRLTGPFPLLRLKQALWNRRHPVQRAFERHVRRSFGARHILVHHRYHADILTRKGIPAHLLQTVPMPVKLSVPPREFVFPELPCVNFGVPGFINPAFDAGLLFAVLECLQRPWTFTWIGGVRREDQRPLLEELTSYIARHGWQDRFTVTGWVTEGEMTSRLARCDIVLALFKTRSSSASLARAMGACKPIIATELPLTVEIAATGKDGEPPLLLTSANPDAVIALIEKLLAETDLQRRLFRGLSAAIETTSFERTAAILGNLYREIIFR